MKKIEMKFDWDDVLIPAEVITDIVHRKDVNIFDNNGYLPLFTAPMDTVINKENLHIFEENKIIPILPRTEKIDNYDNWFSVGLKDFEDIINESPICKMKVLLDVANGHMSQVLELTKRAKEKFGDNMTLMVGNIANPKTYEVLSNAGADYIRCGVGNGGGCWIAGSKIKTDSGYKNIEDINTDDIVLTHTGEYKNVILTHELNYYDDLIDINGEISTKEHEYYVISKNDSHLVNIDNYQEYAIWIKAEDLSEQYLLLKLEDISYIKMNLIEINKKEIKNEQGIRVYDITVKDNHSYTVNNIIVHNCLTTEQSGIGYPMASLISEIYEISCTLKTPAKIVADGGFKKYADIIKALALGADYVMIGSIFNKALESCGDTFREIKVHNSWSEPGELVNQYNIDIKNMFKNGTNFYKKFRGMSTKDVQKSLGNTELKTSEGISKINKVEYTLDGWVENFSHYLRNNMSYTNCFDLNEYIGKVEYVMITPNAFKRFNK